MLARSGTCLLEPRPRIEDEPVSETLVMVANFVAGDLDRPRPRQPLPIRATYYAALGRSIVHM